MANLSLLLGTLLLSFSILESTCLCCPQYQKAALLEFKSLVLGDSADNSSADKMLGGLETWNSSSDCCRWEMVRCFSRGSQKR
ncbi:hypothetical protein AB3S75_031549 [Citrus x aurantiifolia]